MSFYTPTWVHNAVFYHIFPERFANGNPDNDPPGTVPWGSTPTLDNFMGGDLQGVLDRLGYLTDLGVNAIYFNPIFQARSNHKFDHGDYFKVDPHFGTNELMRRLVKEAHELGIRIILDISHNHSGREFFAFQDVVAHNEHSQYRDWYHFREFPVSEPEKPNYKSWWGIGTLPEFNTDHPDVRRYFKDVTRYWMEEIGIDGWRLDVANEVPHDYWAEWRQFVKSINPEAYLVGEIWGDGTPWLQGDNFDAVMNYVWRDLVHQFLIDRKIGPSHFHEGITALLGRHPECVNLAMFNMLGSHDTPRVLTEASGMIERVRLAFVHQMTYIGAPVIYYGDEIGLEGGKDPDCRRAFPWDPYRWNRDLRDLIKRLISMRKIVPAFRSTEYHAVVTDDQEGVYVYRRGRGSESHFVVLNNSDIERPCAFSITDGWPADGIAVDLLTHRLHPVRQGKLITVVPRNDALILGLRDPWMA